MALIPPDAGIGMRMQTALEQLPPAAPVSEIPSDLPELRPGQAFSARIQEVLPENTYRALVAGKQLTLQLPEGAKAGDTLELVVVGRTARAIVAQLAAPPAEPGAGQAYPYATLSRAGQIIGNLLLPEGTAPQPTALNGGRPLLPAPPTTGTAAADVASPAPQSLAPALQKAVAQSGLFYESHLAQWSIGRLPLEQVLQEPQAQRSAPAILAEHGIAPRVAAREAGSGAAAQAEPSPLRSIFGADRAETSPQAQQAQAAATNAVPEELRPIVQQQLDAVATQRLIWHGEAWPNQPIEWEIAREQERDNASAEGEEAGWRTTLRLDMPRLGHVDAALRLTSAGIQIAIAAPDEATAADLRDGAAALASALESAGISLIALQVRHVPQG